MSEKGAFVEAINYFASKEILHPDKFYSLAEDARAKAFTVSGVTNLRILKDVHAEVEKVLTDGGTLKTFQEAFNGILRDSGYAPANPRHIETVFRQNIQTSYNVGRYGKQMERADLRPWWAYNSIDDSGTTPLCYELGGHAGKPAACYRCDHPFWDTFYPPNHFNCRSGVDDLSDDDLDEEGITPLTDDMTGQEYYPVLPDGSVSGEPVKLLPPDGFAVNPGKVAWKPDMSRFSDDERKIFERAYEDRFGPVRDMGQLKDRLNGIQENFKLMGAETRPIDKIVIGKTRDAASIRGIDMDYVQADMIEKTLSTGKVASLDEAEAITDVIDKFSRSIGIQPDFQKMETDHGYVKQIEIVNNSWSRLFYPSFCDSLKLQNYEQWSDKILQSAPEAIINFLKIPGFNLQKFSDLIWTLKIKENPSDYETLLRDGIKKIQANP